MITPTVLTDSMEPLPEMDVFPDTLAEIPDTQPVKTQLEDTISYTQTEDTPRDEKGINETPLPKSKKSPWLHRLSETANNDDTPRTKIQKLQSQIEEAQTQEEEKLTPEDDKKTLKDLLHDTMYCH